MTRWVTGSGLDRAMSCPGSMVLPGGYDPKSREAKAGNMIHAAVEHRATTQHFESDEELAEWYPRSGFHEVIAWYDPLTRTAGLAQKSGRAHRDYSPFPPHYLVGTIDYLHPPVGSSPPWVDDIKTGRVVAAPTSMQHLLAAVAVSAQYAWPEVKSSTTHLLRGSRYKARDATILSPLDLGYARSRFEALRARWGLESERQALGAALDLVPGDHCRFCHSRDACPRVPDRFNPNLKKKA